MDYFVLNKYQSIQENILFSAKALYELLSDAKHIDVLFTEYADQQDVILNINLERVLYLSLTFLYSIGMIDVNTNMVMRVVK